MLASRLPTILPDLDPDTALVTTALHSVSGPPPPTDPHSLTDWPHGSTTVSRPPTSTVSTWR